MMKNFVAQLQAMGPAGIFLLALLDGVGVPLPGGVDSLLVFLSVTNPDQAYFYAAITLIASLAGGLILFYMAKKGGEAFMNRHTSTGRGLAFKHWFLKYGLITVFVPAFIIIPMPLKVFVICAGAMGISARSYILTLLAARIPRFFGLAWLGRNYGQDAGPWLKAHALHFGLAALVIYAGIYFATRMTAAQTSEV